MNNKIKKYTIVTYGCQMNEHDSEKIAYILENLGYVSTNEINDTDFIIYNTCLVRENAELKVYGQLGSLKPLKKENPDMIIAVCGCMMQTGEAREVIQKKYRHVDIIFGTKNISSLPTLINRHLSTGNTVIDIEERDLIDNQIDMKRLHPFIGYINIMTGCNNFCTYCIVPYARGREDSRTPESILAEIKDLANKGYKEITLLGQNVNSYGKTLEKPVPFPDLLRMINAVDGIERIRFLTSHPKDLSDDLINAMAECDKVCNNLHLPFQAGSNSILKSMNRKYTQEDYLLLVEKLKEKIPNITLSTDIIVGFPGETEEDFEETLKVVKKVKYDQGFTFLYSKREGTKAAVMENQVDKNVAQVRFEKLLETMYEIFYENNSKYIGKVEKVLVEGPSKNNEEYLTGRTEGFKLVHFKGNKNLIGTIVNVKITNHNSFSLNGEMV
ncbi:tRNA (N6-isopentenyl adenosine(37)-C2)-methylthiotransferase MiaB [Miniphocaeibacter massiliensis]|uniref:tRNA (N6-isopentenyl adenosine(37)-C2)-methylthiotransferase MiaB n=1 Tax=Miniphocaeibacter massiliensis TaxID=2041841 RepID=UPI000C087EBE|nr:tRNA (N6-isopentenyl adenosine(37)-C2)-methylthiotransferase MiaB [Miniphocaeibacter massiliensis]